MTKKTSFHYWAFISYSSGDKSWARWLHKAIESYRIPARLVSHPTPTRVPAPKRFKPIFHDRSELPASSDLDAKIENALRTSRYLIVICSPQAAQSKWVNKEVETFLLMRRPGSVLAIIVDGEPNSGNDQECFPASLRSVEPIAADVRQKGDGRNNSKLKLLAGMLGVGFDELKQRDTQRNIRRMQYIIGLSLIFILGFAGLAFYAEQQRTKAFSARQQAESILEYLMFDLRDKLEPIGRLDIVRDVQGKVDAYYRELGIEKNSPRTQRNQKIAYMNKGNLLMDQGNLVGALHEFRESLVISQRMVAADSSNLDWQRDIIVIYKKIGDVLFTQGDLAGALKAYRGSLTVAERLTVIDPSNVSCQWDLSVSQGEIGNVLLSQGNLAGALKVYRKSLEVQTCLVAADPLNLDWQQDILISQNKIGDVLFAQGDLAAALKAYRESLAVVTRLATADSSNVNYRRELSVSNCKIGDMLFAQGDLPGAFKAYRDSQVDFQRLAMTDPSNVGKQRDFLVSYFKIGDVLLAQGNLAEALRAYRDSMVIVSRLVVADSSNMNLQRDLFAGHNRIGNVLFAQGDLDGALKAFREFQVVCERLSVKDPLNASWKRDLLLSKKRIGEVLFTQGNLVAALNVYRESLLMTERLANTDPSNVDWQRDLLENYLRLAEFIEKTRRSGARAWWQKAYDQLGTMKKRGIMKQGDEEALEYLKGKVGG